MQQSIIYQLVKTTTNIMKCKRDIVNNQCATVMTSCLHYIIGNLLS